MLVIPMFATVLSVPIDHEHRDSDVFLPAWHFLKTLSPILSETVLRRPCLATFLQIFCHFILNSKPGEPMAGLWMGGQTDELIDGYAV